MKINKGYLGAKVSSWSEVQHRSVYWAVLMRHKDEVLNDDIGKEELVAEYVKEIMKPSNRDQMLDALSYSGNNAHNAVIENFRLQMMPAPQRKQREQSKKEREDKREADRQERNRRTQEVLIKLKAGYRFFSQILPNGKQIMDCTVGEVLAWGRQNAIWVESWLEGLPKEAIVHEVTTEKKGHDAWIATQT